MEVNFSNADYDGLSASIILGKRKREEEEAKAVRTRLRLLYVNLNDVQALQGEEISEEMSTQPPNPKRPTLASQKLQRKMLAKPFRSPAMTPKAAEATPAVKKEAPPPEQLLGKAKDADLKKHRTQRAAGQFKSPLPLALAGSVPTAVRQTPTVQTLERKVQVLKRAVQVRKDGEEETLEGLVRKWTEAGREVAWEVWGLVKDNENGGGDDWGEKSQGASSSSGKRRFEDSWGWNEESGSKRVKVEEGERNWGWDVSPATASSEQDQDHPKVVETVEDEEKPRDTLGTMLMRLGIAPSTLGWDDEEGEFVDE
ncbi:hypothetical protein C8F04DRAFT_1205497 [Mycena alexandri]|uniref:Uncharacterized protein n=1 Tax=Mycena alexandri TaxID=1745969 RepID=A0AAD6TJN8_9AGAR|nr:hypothetical protein C8F04DRAFT_1205497 [Mycena alexandri]